MITTIPELFSSDRSNHMKARINMCLWIKADLAQKSKGLILKAKDTSTAG